MTGLLVSSAGVNFIDLIAAITGNFPDKRLDSDRAKTYNTQQYLFVKLPS